jgi:hypothetical protein
MGSIGLGSRRPEGGPLGNVGVDAGLRRVTYRAFDQQLQNPTLRTGLYSRVIL